MSKDYDKATEKSEPAPKGHAQAVKEAIEDHRRGHVPHPSMQPMPNPEMAKGGFNGPGGAVA